MRYALVADIHANLPAWNAVHDDIRCVGADAILCLGDMVGYGPDPAAVLERLHAQVHAFVLGNHDAVIGGMLTADRFNRNARVCIDWTRAHLGPAAVAFFRQLPHVMTGPGFCCTHADPAAPTRFRYLATAEDAQRAWSVRTEPLLFVGHTHVPGLFVRGSGGEPPCWQSPHDFVVEPGHRYIVNVGSVGQSRDGDPTAAYCLFETDTGSVCFRRVAFDRDGYREQLVAAGLPLRADDVLRAAPVSQPAPLRPHLEFRPPAAAVEPVEVRDLEPVRPPARRALRRKCRLLLILAAVSALAAARGCRHRRGHLSFAAREWRAVRTAPERAGAECLSMPVVTGVVTRRNRLQYWTVHVTAPAAPEVAVEARSGLPVFRVHSEQPAGFAILAPLVRARPGMRFTAAAEFYVPRALVGELQIELRQQGPDGTEIVLLQHPVLPLPAGRWTRRARSMPRRQAGLERPGPVRWVLKGRCAGELLVRGCSLSCREIHPRAARPATTHD